MAVNVNLIANILVVLDPTVDEQPALDKAVQLARKCDARLELLACETQESRRVRYATHLASGSQEGFIVNLRARLEALAEPIRAQGIDVSSSTDEGDPLHRLLLRRIVRSEPGLVIKDTHHHSLAQRTFITHTDWHLIRACPAPLLLVKPRLWRTSAPVLAAAIDPGHAHDQGAALEQQILRWSQWLAQRLGTPLQVLHAFLPLVLAAEAASGGAALGGGLSIQAAERALTTRRAELAEIAASYGLPAGNVHVEVGVASQVLPALARSLEVDVLTMGAVSRSGLSRIFIGSTAERVLEAMPCDVLVLKK